MTPAQTQPGAEMDAQVARMLGWTDVQPMSGVLYGLRPGTEYHYYKIPKYSADWGCAGLVIEHMRKVGWQFKLFSCDVGYAAAFAPKPIPGSSRRFVSHQAANPSAPAAIAIAALAATGGEG